MAFLDDFESEYGTGEGDFQAGQIGNTFTNESIKPSEGEGGGYVGFNLNDQEMIDWEKRMGSGSGSRMNLDDDAAPSVAREASNYGNGGGGGGGRGTSISSGNSITYQRPLKETPVLGDYGAAPTYTKPTYDEGKVRSLQQEKAGTGISKLRSAVSEAITRSVSMDNPYLRKMLLKSTLSGFGEGMGGVMDSADTTARRAYDTEYQGKVDETNKNYQGSLTTYQNNVNRVNTMFEAAMKDYMANPYDMTVDPMTGKKYPANQNKGA